MYTMYFDYIHLPLPPPGVPSFPSCPLPDYIDASPLYFKSTCSVSAAQECMGVGPSEHGHPTRAYAPQEESLSLPQPISCKNSLSGVEHHKPHLSLSVLERCLAWSCASYPQLLWVHECNSHVPSRGQHFTASLHLWLLRFSHVPFCDVP